MYNANLPNCAELPSAGKLLKSTVIAGVSALAILFGALLPAEYGIDPTGVGRMLGLTQMGEIKLQLAQEAADDAAKAVGNTGQSEALVAIETRLRRIEEHIANLQVAKSAEAIQAEPVPEAPAAVPEPTPTVTEAAPGEAVAAPAATTDVKSDVVEIVLEPGQGAEVKLEMAKDAEVNFTWAVVGGVVNFDAHGDPPNAAKSFYHGYGKGKGSAGETGTLKAAFDGNHGWFWRNRGGTPVTLRLETKGSYVKLKRVV